MRQKEPFFVIDTIPLYQFKMFMYPFVRSIRVPQSVRNKKFSVLENESGKRELNNRIKY